MTYDRQLETVRNLAILPHGYDDLRSYTVEQIERTPSLMVTRSYSRIGLRAEYRECYIIGPRGGSKTIYKNFF